MARSTRLLPALAAVLAGTFALGACGGDASGEPPSTADADITISTFQFQPNPATVEGGTFTVKNADNTTHTFTSGAPGAPDGVFKLELTGPDASASVDVAPGTYQFFCEIHPSMTGEVTVA